MTPTERNKAKTNLTTRASKYVFVQQTTKEIANKKSDRIC